MAIYRTLLYSVFVHHLIIALSVVPVSFPDGLALVFFFSWSTEKHFQSRRVSSAAAETTVSPSGDIAIWRTRDVWESCQARSDCLSEFFLCFPQVRFARGLPRLVVSSSRWRRRCIEAHFQHGGENAIAKSNARYIQLQGGHAAVYGQGMGVGGETSTSMLSLVW